MHSDLTARGCLNAAIGLFLLVLLCFVAGLFLQVGWATLSRAAAPVATPQPVVLPTLEPTATLPPSPSPLPEEVVVTATASPEPTATATRRASPTARATATVDSSTYTVQSGDTLFSIAAEFDLTVAELLEANPEIDPNVIQVGQELVIP